MRKESIAPPPNHIETTQAEWQMTASYPEPLRHAVRWKTLIGGNGADWLGGVPQKDVIVGVLDLEKYSVQRSGFWNPIPNRPDHVT